MDYPSLWPEDRFDRAYARSLASEMATSFGAVRAYAMNIRQSYPFDPKFFTPKTDKELTRLSSIWEELRAKAVASGQKDEGYLFGRFTALDAMYAPLMFRLLSYDLISRVTGSHAQRYVQHMLNSASMKEWEADSKKETAIIPSDELYPDTL
ncbi:hypothetical protein BGW38_000223 [Lunasporangiospora selenospora]|uniref:Glutathione S-transferase n=1 Tax=Lunasporangiospora selenospora TaxID=979761 RepID=A0A9P6FXE2_9FUNG|nr:hypothetical protein BGW38_000223 [Lunasporangiospora selenospora]